MNKQGNLYTFIYASAMVIIVAAVLSFAAETLKPRQAKNIEIEKKLDILKSVGKAENVSSAPDKNEYVEKEYDTYITSSFVVNSKGELVQGHDAFKIDLKTELSKKLEDRNLPIFVCKLEDGSEKLILPVRGKGLWGPVWGYISLNDDYNTVYGAVFAHKSETPGLGAEIDKPFFQVQFKGKKIFENDAFVSIGIIKGGAGKDNLHGVDAISGGTITSKGVEDMLKDCIKSYVPYFNSKKN